MKRVGLTLALVAVAAVLSGADALACGQPEDARPLRRDWRRRMSCELQRARGYPVSCENPEATCAPALDELVSVLDGISETRSCYREFYRQSKRYLGRRLRELGRATRPAAEAVRFVEKIEQNCAAETLSPGGVCASFTEPRAVGLCVRALVEALAQNGIGQTVAPNVVLVLTDDQRWDTLWTMPRLQELVIDRGLEFTNSFTSTSLCCPDRASIFTGLYAHNHGVTSNAGAQSFDHDGDTIQRQLRENGAYRTALLGKYFVGTGATLGGTPAPGWDQWHVFTDDGGFSSTHGLYYNYRLSTNGTIQRYAPLDAFGEPTREEEYSTDLLRDRTVALIQSWRGERFFVEYAPFAPHTPSNAADRHLGSFDGTPLHRPPNHMEVDLTQKPAWLAARRALIQLAGGEPAATDARRVRMFESLLAVDEAIEAISDRLEETGLTDNTLLVFTSDNGYAWLEHWLNLKNYPYEESVRVPLAVRYPVRIHEPRQVSELVQSIDFYPTFAELAGVSGEPVNGRSLVPLFDGDASGWRQEILLEHYGPVAGIETSSAIRTHDWKLIRTDATSGVTLELYDMNADPFELDNVADEPTNAALIATLGAQLDVLEQQ